MIRRTVCSLILAIASVATPSLAQDEKLPTPYSAEQIRDAWSNGLAVVTHITTPDGVTRSRTVVTKWSADRVSLSDQPLDEQGRPQGEPTVFESTWDGLRDHALFPADRAQRERGRRETPLGELEGWIYTVTHASNDHSEFFFADAYPGAPVVYQRTTGGQVAMHAVMVERTGGDAP